MGRPPLPQARLAAKVTLPFASRLDRKKSTPKPRGGEGERFGRLDGVKRFQSPTRPLKKALVNYLLGIDLLLRCVESG